ncbi:signal-transducing histidine kinase/response regulator [Halanaeroarchaeum sulfurireducens]|uniref:histidine kinase n=2 Tax=Halanaeroarchaeum sulfurireducens TaxID=1604004 RepID=A0A0F7PCK8_9EURY|nr:signal-transducing histidine kinase/response regulator [Halanaeroarchaeum sulfurireducens]ALG81781.1 signal-transducing histidine kinase/response regulator [Halanaeroarchaeum sulfurireducens]
MLTTEQLPKHILDQTRDGIRIVQDCEIIYANDSFAEMAGYDKAEIVGQPSDFLIASEHVDQIRELHTARMAGEDPPETYEVALTTNGGSTLPVELSVSRIQIEGGPASLSIFRDITERKRRERELQNKRENLRRTEELGNMGGWVWNVESDAIEFTDGLNHVLGLSNDGEFTLEAAIEMVDADHRQDIDRAIEQCLENERPFDQTVRLVTREGNQIWAEILGECAEEPDGLKMRGVMRDVTHLREREQRLKVLNRVLRHNLRNDLNNVVGRSQMIDEQLSDIHSSAAEKRAQSIKTHFAKIRTTLCDLLSLAEKTRRFGSVIETIGTRRHTDLKQMLTEIGSAYRTEYPDADIRIHADRVDAYGYPAAIKMTVKELLENAITHNDSEDPAVTITTEQIGDSVVRIEIRDNGPGIPETEKTVLESGEETPLEHGSGIGLWLANWLVLRNKGTIHISENEPRGTVVTVELPAGS